MLLSSYLYTLRDTSIITLKFVFTKNKLVNLNFDYYCTERKTCTDFFQYILYENVLSLSNIEYNTTVLSTTSFICTYLHVEVVGFICLTTEPSNTIIFWGFLNCIDFETLFCFFLGFYL